MPLGNSTFILLSKENIISFIFNILLLSGFAIFIGIEICLCNKEFILYIGFNLYSFSIPVIVIGIIKTFLSLNLMYKFPFILSIASGKIKI